MKKLTAIVMGLGGRGRHYCNVMDGEKIQVVGIAEPVDSLRNHIKNLRNIPDDKCFLSWEDILNQPKMADIAVIATMDQMHFEPAIKAMDLGYDLLLEKPISNDPDECIKIANYAKEKGRKILVCHVLRYTPFFMTIKKMINEGKVGKVMSVHHAEMVGNRHQSHSFVRGNWGNSKRSSCMILQKSCHDMDIIQWIVGSPCKRVQSFGSLTYFTRENAPEGSPERCIEGCPHAESCYYNSVKLYLEDEKNTWFRRASSMKANPTNEDMEWVLWNTQYGKCVYKCDNDVVDKQVVNLEFENGAVASFNMCAFNQGGRYIRIMGTDGEIYGDFERSELYYYDFKTKKREQVEIDVESLNFTGHGGGDQFIADGLYEYIANDCDASELSEINISTKNHLIAFAAEKSRLEGTVIDMKEYEKEMGLK